MNITSVDYFTFNVGNSLLIVGATASGKSYLCEEFFSLLIDAKKPEQLRFVILDMTNVDAQVVRQHPEYIEELVEGTDPIEQAFDTLEKYAELAKTGRPDEKSEIVIFIEECNMARANQAKFEHLISVITQHAAAANMRLIYSTSVIAPDTVSPDLIDMFDIMLAGHQYSAEACEYLGVPGSDGLPPFGFYVVENLLKT